MYLLVEKEEKEHKYLRKQMNFPAFWNMPLIEVLNFWIVIC